MTETHEAYILLSVVTTMAASLRSMSLDSATGKRARLDSPS